MRMRETLSYMSTPTATVREKILALLEAEITDIKIYDYFPTMGVTAPSIVMQNITGTLRNVGFGHIVATDTRGHEIRQIIQIDIYHNSRKECDEYFDKVLVVIQSNESILLSTYGVRQFPVDMIPDFPTEGTGSRLYRGLMRIPFSIVMTRAA
jgi:hypothetical protein